MSTKLSRVQVVGVLLLVGGMAFVMAVNIAEMVYPGYNGGENWISDLGSTCSYSGTYFPHDCVYVQPASAIFTTGMVTIGALLLASAYLAFPFRQSRRLFIFLGLAGVGCVGAGLVSEQYPPYHSVFSLLVFLFGSLAAIDSFRFVPRPLGYISLVLAGISLVALGILLTVGGEIVAPTWTPLGRGGMERMLAYPELLWVMAFGATLIALPNVLSRPAGLRAASGESLPSEMPAEGRSAKPPV